MRSDKQFAQIIPLPGIDAHKYSRGKAVVIAGSAKYPGAACLCAQSSQLSGAGYTHVFTDESNVFKVQLARPSLVVSSFDSFDAAHLFSENNPGAVVVGPGFDLSDKLAEKVLFSVLEHCEKPVLVDGGALGMVASAQGRLALKARQQCGFSTVLTPHGGEAYRLATSARSAYKNLTNSQLADALSEEYGAVVVLKGPDTTVSLHSSQASEIITNGTAALSKAGTGDVLAGVIGGFLSQGINPFDAACLGVYLHAKAGCLSAQNYGIVSVCAEEVMHAIPRAIQETLLVR